LQSGPEFPRIDGAAVILVEAGERFAARFDLLVREGHPHTEAQPRLRPSGCCNDATRTAANFCTPPRVSGGSFYTKIPRSRVSSRFVQTGSRFVKIRSLRSLLQPRRRRENFLP
jgi:hypothetical protein